MCTLKLYHDVAITSVSRAFAQGLCTSGLRASDGASSGSDAYAKSIGGSAGIVYGVGVWTTDEVANFMVIVETTIQL